MVQPLTYDDVDSKIKERILPISPSHTILILALELSFEIKWCELVCWDSRNVSVRIQYGTSL